MIAHYSFVNVRNDLHALTKYEDDHDAHQDQGHVHLFLLSLQTLCPSGSGHLLLETHGFANSDKMQDMCHQMIPSARPTIPPVAIIVFAWNLFCFARFFWKVRTDGRTGGRTDGLHVRKLWSLLAVTVVGRMDQQVRTHQSDPPGTM